jgi:hypothetical protein
MQRCWIVLLGVFVALAASSGCGRGQVSDPEGMTDSDLVRLYGPANLEILPFTRPKSFDDDPIPDGIEVSLRPVDKMGDPVKAYGTFRFELHRWREASGQRAGERLETWTQQVLSPEQQRQFWDTATSTYTFQLAWEGGEFPPPDRKYLLQATFQAPGGERLFAEYTFAFRVPRAELEDTRRRTSR